MYVNDIDINPEGLKKCCGEEPIFHCFTHFGFAVECSVNGHIHCTHVHESKEAAKEAWNRRADNG